MPIGVTSPILRRKIAFVIKPVTKRFIVNGDVKRFGQLLRCKKNVAQGIPPISLTCADKPGRDEKGSGTIVFLEQG